MYNENTGEAGGWSCLYNVQKLTDCCNTVLLTLIRMSLFT